MSAWLRNSNSRKSLNIWADDVASEVEKDKSQTASSRTTRHRPSTTTVVDADGLPLPNTHGERYSIGSGRRKHQRGARFGVLRLAWQHFKRHLGTGSAPSSSSLNDESAVDSMYLRKLEGVDRDWVDEVVVDRVWSEEFHSSVSHSDDDESPPKTGSNNQTGQSDYGSTTGTLLVHHRIWHLVMEIFSSRFEDERREKHYQQEDWYVKKKLAIWTGFWLVLNWALGCLFTKLPGRSLTVGDKIFLFGIAPVLTVPILIMVLYNWPRDRPLLYQIALLCGVWCWSFYTIIYMRACRFFSDRPDCQGKDFMGTFYWSIGLQTVGLFGLKLKRFPAAMGALTFFLFSCIAIVPVRTIWIRHMINFFLYHSFLIYVHYIRESSERRLYTLRDQLKIQYKATQKAQINERRSSDSKRRLTSYVFHEVRVPLNTALLAVQNMAASGTVAKEQELEFSALYGSLEMMSKVLNDVLDFNRLDSGKFESASKPYAFHHVMRTLFQTLQLATDARQLTFETQLDPNVDKVARRLAYEAMGETKENIRRHIREHPDIDGVVAGDEARLRQIITNLANNACKFTPAGGKLTIKTKLVLPSLEADDDPLEVELGNEVTSPSQNPSQQGNSRQRDNATQQPVLNGQANGLAQGQPLSADYLSQHDSSTRHERKAVEHVVVRIEVSDTGCGIKYEDMLHSKLFSAFNQTEQGIQQGGKGTGLGLALVRQIVKFSGGRLGIQSKVGEGSTFWVELPLGVGKRTFVTRMDSNTTNSESGGDGSGQGSSTVQGGTDGNGCGGFGGGWGHGDAGGGNVREGRGRSKQRKSGHVVGTGTGTTGAKEHHLGLFETPLNDKIGVVTPDAPTALRAAKVRSEAMREHRAMYALMEMQRAQVSRLDLVVKQDDSSVATDAAISSRDAGASSPLAKPCLEQEAISPALPTYRLQTPGGHDVAADCDETRLDDATSSSHVDVNGPSKRPAYVPLPSPWSFSSNSMENQPIGTTSTYQTSTGSSMFSGTSASPMAAFDNAFTHGSPESSTANVNVEPGMNVLVVDDDPLTRTLMKRILTRLGCEVTLAENGEMALDLILGVKGYSGLPVTPSREEDKRLWHTSQTGGGKAFNGAGEGGDSGAGVRFKEQHELGADSAVAALGPPPQEMRYGVVFLDNQMPVMSGIKAVERLRELGRKDFVVGVTGNALLTDQKEYMAAGVDRVLTKPVLERTLREALVAGEERRKEARFSLTSFSQSNSSCNHGKPKSPTQLVTSESSHSLPGPSRSLRQRTSAVLD